MVMCIMHVMCLMDYGVGFVFSTSIGLNSAITAGSQSDIVDAPDGNAALSVNNVKFFQIIMY